MINIIVITISIYMLCFAVEQNEFYPILGWYGLGFIAFFGLANAKLSWVNWLCCLFAFIPLFSFPNLSDDVYRFQWDGELLYNGISPFAYLPNEVPVFKEHLFQSLYPQLNSKEYFSVYPFTLQGVFLIATILSKLGLSFTLAIKLIYLVVHLLGFIFLNKFIKSKGYNINTMYYYLNPLVLVEGLGNLHAEVLMIGLFSMAIYFFSIKKDIVGIVFFCLGITTKLTIAVVFPLLMIYWLLHKEYKKVIFSSMLLILLFIPIFWDKGLFGFMSSLDLYFRKFEFNASIYYLLRGVGKLIFGYNIISFLGPLMACLFLFYIIKTYEWILFKSKINNVEVLLLNGLIFILPLHLFLSTTVHPWYLITILFVNLFFNFRFVYVWSFMMVLSYKHYHLDLFEENMFFIFIEYAIVFLVMYWEWHSGLINQKVENLSFFGNVKKI